jgi:hypothetical protein
MVPSDGDSYILKYNDIVVSSGTISLNGNDLTFNSDSGKTWTAKLDGNSISNISDIETDDGKVITIDVITENPVKDSIKIVSVTPDGNLTDAVQQSFSVTVEYDLSTQEQGELCIGFNSHDVIMYVLDPELCTISKGHDTYTFNVTGLTKNWSGEGDFGVYVNLSPHPHASFWIPLAWEVKSLSFK